MFLAGRSSHENGTVFCWVQGGFMVVFFYLMGSPMLWVEIMGVTQDCRFLLIIERNEQCINLFLQYDPLFFFRFHHILLKCIYQHAFSFSRNQ